MTDELIESSTTEAEAAAAALAIAATMAATVAAIQRGEADWRVGRLVNAELARAAVRNHILTRAEAAAALGCGITAMYARWREHDATAAATLQWQRDAAVAVLAAPVLPPAAPTT